MTYTKEVTNLIVYYWGKGLTAEETRKIINEKTGIKVGLATVYRHRHSLTAEQIIDTLFTDQRRDIALATDIGLRMKYRDNLLTKLMPHKFAIRTEHRDVKVDVKRLEIVRLMETYGEAVDAAVRRNIQSLTKDADKQPLDTSHAHAKAS
jgi:hypothetical protein